MEEISRTLPVSKAIKSISGHQARQNNLILTAIQFRQTNSFAVFLYENCLQHKDTHIIGILINKESRSCPQWFSGYSAALVLRVGMDWFNMAQGCSLLVSSYNEHMRPHTQLVGGKLCWLSRPNRCNNMFYLITAVTKLLSILRCKCTV